MAGLEPIVSVAPVTARLDLTRQEALPLLPVRHAPVDRPPLPPELFLLRLVPRRKRVHQERGVRLVRRALATPTAQVGLEQHVKLVLPTLLPTLEKPHAFALRVMEAHRARFAPRVPTARAGRRMLAQLVPQVTLPPVTPLTPPLVLAGFALRPTVFKTEFVPYAQPTHTLELISLARTALLVRQALKDLIRSLIVRRASLGFTGQQPAPIARLVTTAPWRQHQLRHLSYALQEHSPLAVRQRAIVSAP